ncbi:hypothetical protein KZX37_07850 [Microbacterium sp. EYE_5]|uniref:hypothetical protein n=1 Tax=unclassified Microbacterium TaxID=2609290 RepID=UPI0020062793|nr:MULTISPECIES: hypothetical protein [unclassified Microbacterium]MCK6081575.1 hypothetical protein [Microbacterium sp. EYE_382]MCK6086845.1 hypothetical protein [Microbacterium sp. EYE_384]MCK6123657.1 hypothetical protein [Microbacterium sp. EYE_80]MCK6126566.1 hypothetical protein [Microbacterium sp. EYE_79]MCK6142529.1 hypothetical protein [Microbacterium sp. EYE_39]
MADEPRLDPDAALVDAIDAAASVSMASPEDPAAQERLWRAVFALEKWIFIARGTDEQPTPFAATTEQGPAIFAFSTAQRAQAAAVGFGILPEESGRLLAVPMPDAAGWVASHAEGGVQFMVFDAPQIGALTPLANLAAMAVWIEQHPGD